MPGSPAPEALIRGVTISAGYGAGGAAVALEVARRLDFPVLDRAISSDVAARLQVSVREAEGGELKRSFVGRFFSLLTPLAGGALGAGTDAAPPHVDPAPDDADLFRDQAEQIMRSALATGAVIVGRGAGAAFRDEPAVLRVRLYGSAERRARQAAATQQVSIQTARERLPGVDAARRHYVRRLYHVDIDDPALYQLQIDSTLLPTATCVELVVATFRVLGNPLSA